MLLRYCSCILGEIGTTPLIALTDKEYVLTCCIEAESSLGTGNGGLTYAVFDYQAEHPDELSFKAGDVIMVRRKGDEFENNWWWAKTGDVEGYVARTLLGVSAAC